MKRLRDYDAFGQGIPINKKMSDLETGRLFVVGVQYVTQREFNEMQAELREQLAEQAVIAVKALEELQQIKLHLSSLSDAHIEPGDGAN